MEPRRIYGWVLTPPVTPFQEWLARRGARFGGLVKLAIDERDPRLVQVGNHGREARPDPDNTSALVECAFDEAKGRGPVVVGAGANADPGSNRTRTARRRRPAADAVLVVDALLQTRRPGRVHQSTQGDQRCDGIPILITNPGASR